MNINKINPAICSECSVPPNFAIVNISQKKFSVKCRDCGDEWSEYLEED
jgi:hypothetical protein